MTTADSAITLGTATLAADGLATVQFVPPPLLRSSGLHTVMRRPPAERTMRRNPRAI
jgi:hypothetical protein